MSEFLARPLNTIVRDFNSSKLEDAKSFVTYLLAPAKLGMNRRELKFSRDLLISVILEAAESEMDITLGDLVKAVGTKYKQPEHTFLDMLTKRFGRKGFVSDASRAVKEFKDDFARQFKGLSCGVARVLVQKSYEQWISAMESVLTEEERKEYGFTSRIKKDDPDLYAIRIGTPNEWADVTAFATKILASIKADTDKETYDFSYRFLVFVTLCTLHAPSWPGVDLATMELIFAYPIDTRWDCVSQQFGQLSCAGQDYWETKTGVFMEKFAAEQFNKEEDVQEVLVKTAHSLWVKGFAGKAAGKAAGKKITGKGNKAAVAEVVVKARPANEVRIFDLKMLGEAETRAHDVKQENRGGALRLLRNAKENDGYRVLPDVKKAHVILEKAKSQFENLVTPISFLQKNLALSGAMKAEDFGVRPIILLGDPGVGKTMLAAALAESLSGRMEKVGAGSCGHDLNGLSTYWTKAKQGQVFTSLAEGTTASPVFVIDEIDKTSDDPSHPLLPVLLELLEPGTAKVFRDEFFEVTIDASRIIFIMTANDLSGVSEPLLSRCEIFFVPRPGAEQRMRIIKDNMKFLNAKTGQKIKLDKVSGQALADSLDIDMRLTVSYVKDAFATAMIAKAKVAKIVLPDSDKAFRSNKSQYSRTDMGFLNKTPPVLKEAANRAVAEVVSRKHFSLDLGGRSRDRVL